MIRFKRADGKESDPVFDSTLCEPSLNLLAHAQTIELDIGSRCGGHGICGGDRVKLPLKELAGFSQITPLEKAHLNDEELMEGWRLACQCFPESRGMKCDVSFFPPQASD